MENNENKGLTVGGYRNLDVFIFTLLACLVELINLVVFKRFFSSELYSLSLVVPLTLIVMQRWNGWAVFVAAFAGLAFCVGNGADTISQYAVYIVGNCFILLNLFWYRLSSKRKVGESAGLRIVFTLTGFLLAIVGRTVVSLLFLNDVGVFEAFMEFAIADGLNIAIGILVLWIAGKQKDLFKDQMEYLRELQEERDKNKNKLSSVTGGTHEGRSIEESDSERTDT